jgi:phosphoglycolate phosphatase
MKKIEAVIFDVDNTLYDFTDFYNPAMEALISGISKKSGVSKDQLITEFKTLHQREGTSEYVFAVQELPSLQKLHPGQDIVEIYQDAIYDFRKARKEHLKLYDGVYETLKQLKDSGTRLIAYTESPGYHAMSRLKQLGLDGLLDVVYSMPDHKIPKNVDLDVVRMYPDSKYRFKETEMRFTPKGIMKPNPASVKAILHDLNIDKDKVLYVGDHLMKDVSMAKKLGLNSAHASYGVYMDPKKYGLLPRLSFWTDEMLEKEKKFHDANPVKPDVTLKTMSDLLKHYDFVAYQAKPKKHDHFTPSPFDGNGYRR